MNKIKYLLLLSIAFVAFSLTSCNDDDEYFDSKYQSREIVINKIYLEDYESSVPDREVTFARLGQMIRVEGSGLYGMKQVLVNGYDTYFNRTYVTDNSMLITLNGSTPITEAEESVRDKITFIKDKVQTTIDFEIKAAAPTITKIDNTLPAVGETVYVYGNNLHETESIELPGGVMVEVADCDDKEGKYYSFVMPEGVTESGSITSVGVNGTAKTPPYFNYSECMILDFEEDNQLGIWSATYAYIVTDDYEGTYMDDYETDPVGDGARGRCCPFIPQRIIDEDGVAPNVAPKGWFTAGNDNEWDDWTRMYSYIDPSTTVDKIAFQFDLYCPVNWDHGQLEFTLDNNLAGYGYGSANTKATLDVLAMATVYIPWLDGEEVVPFTTGERWETITIPISNFGKYQIVDDNSKYTYTLQDVVEDRNTSSYRNFGMFLVNYDLDLSTSDEEENVIETSNFTDMILTDNWRIVPYEFYTVSDYPEDDEE